MSEQDAVAEKKQKPFPCPECSEQVGPGTGTDPYKHAINCLHLEDRGAKYLLDQVAGKRDVRSRRITEILSRAQ